MENTTAPISEINRSGATEKEVTPFQASDSIFLSEYLLSPATRAEMPYCTVVIRLWIRGCSPRRNSRYSGKQARFRRASADISRQSA